MKAPIAAPIGPPSAIAAAENIFWAIATPAMEPKALPTAEPSWPPMLWKVTSSEASLLPMNEPTALPRVAAVFTFSKIFAAVCAPFARFVMIVLIAEPAAVLSSSAANPSTPRALTSSAVRNEDTAPMPAAFKFDRNSGPKVANASSTAVVVD